MSAELQYFIGGVNGVGKTTLLENVDSLHLGFNIVKGSDRFMKWLGLQAGDYTSLRNLPNDYKNTQFAEMIDHLVYKQHETDVSLLLDAHYLLCKRGEVIDTTGPWFARMDVLIVLTADPSVIHRRILEDPKDRDVFPPNISTDEQISLITLYQGKTLAKVKELSEQHGIPYFEIDNSHDHVSLATYQLYTIHETLIS